MHKGERKEAPDQFEQGNLNARQVLLEFGKWMSKTLSYFP